MFFYEHCILLPAETTMLIGKCKILSLKMSDKKEFKMHFYNFHHRENISFPNIGMKFDR